MKITGPTDIFGENRDYKTIIREPFAKDLAHMFDESTVPLNLEIYISESAKYICEILVSFLYYSCILIFILKRP